MTSAWFIARRKTGETIRGPFASRDAAKAAWQREIEPGLRGSSDAHAVRCFNHHARQPDQRRGGVRIFRAVMGVDLEAVRHG